jgi:hypothetical protein
MATFPTMTRRVNRARNRLLEVGVALVIVAMTAVASETPKDEPFYRRFLIPGDPLDEKIKEQEKRVEANPKSAALRNDFGNLLALRRFPREAREQYEAAMKLDKKNFLAPYNLGIVYETEGKFSQALSAYEKSADINRGFPPSLFRMGRLLEMQGHTERAIEAYAKALRIDPSMRDPQRNPLAVDTRLLDRVSLSNYEKDMATASLAWDERYVEEARFRKVPTDRAVWSDEVGDTGIRPVPLAPSASGAPAIAPPAAVTAPPTAVPKAIPPTPVAARLQPPVPTPVGVPPPAGAPPQPTPAIKGAPPFPTPAQ